jgi:hypothetical protein
MVEKYLVFDNGSKSIRDMEELFDKAGINYVTVFKTKDSRAIIFPPNHEPDYKEKDFWDLKAKIMRENKWFLRYSCRI